MASQTIISDYHPEIMKLMRRNIVSFSPKKPHELSYSLIDWDKTKYEDMRVLDCAKMTDEEWEESGIVPTDEDDVEDLKIKVTKDRSIKEYGKLDFIVGADIVYWS